MKDTIYRQDAIDVINVYLGLSSVSREIQNMTNVPEILEKLPSAVNTGKWVEGIKRDNRTECSVCGIRQDIKAKFLFSFCPNCGAKMENAQ